MSSRLEQVNALITKEVAQIIREEVEFAPGLLVTVTGSKTSVDLRYATVYISVLPAHKGPSTLAKLQRHGQHVQHVLNQKLVMRHRPKLRFELDRGEEHARTIESILAQEKRFGPRWHGKSQA